MIVAAIDRDNNSQTVVETAESLANAYNEQLQIVHVLNQREFIELEQTSYDQTGNIKDMSEIRGVAREIANKAAEDVERPYEAIGLVGNASQRIIDHTTEVDARYVIIGGTKRSPAGKAIFGSTSQTILLNSNCPVVSTI